MKTADQIAERIRALRSKLQLTQTELAELLGVSFATVNRWENAQSKPSKLAWDLIVQAESRGRDAFGKPANGAAKVHAATTAAVVEIVPSIDFSADPMIVKAVAEGERLSFGHLFNPTFATETS